MFTAQPNYCLAKNFFEAPASVRAHTALCPEASMVIESNCFGFISLAVLLANPSCLIIQDIALSLRPNQVRARSAP